MFHWESLSWKGFRWQKDAQATQTEQISMACLKLASISAVGRVTDCVFRSFICFALLVVRTNSKSLLLVTSCHRFSENKASHAMCRPQADYL